MPCTIPDLSVPVEDSHSVERPGTAPAAGEGGRHPAVAAPAADIATRIVAILDRLDLCPVVMTPDASHVLELCMSLSAEPARTTSAAGRRRDTH